MSTVPRENREQIQSLIREVVVLNTDIGEAEKEFIKRFAALKSRLSKIYFEADDELNNNTKTD